MYAGHIGSPQFRPLEQMPSTMNSVNSSAESNSNFTFDSIRPVDPARNRPDLFTGSDWTPQDDDEFWGALLHDEGSPATAEPSHLQQRNAHLEAENLELRKQCSAWQQHAAALEQRNATLVAEQAKLQKDKFQMEVKKQMEIAIRTIYADEILKQQAAENAARIAAHGR